MKNNNGETVQPYNKNSKVQDKNLKEATDKLLEYAMAKFKLPEGYSFSKWSNLSYDKIYNYMIKSGVDPSLISDFLKKSGNNEYFSIEPDGGIIVACKRDESGNLLDWKPLLSAEGKFQSDSVGNACERYFKNHDVFRNLFDSEDIFPYFCFCDGAGMNDDYIKGKFTIGIGNNLGMVDIYNKKITYKNGKTVSKQIGHIIINQGGTMVPDEMYGYLIRPLRQAVLYFFPEENKELAQ